jgi:hypothetical protein
MWIIVLAIVVFVLLMIARQTRDSFLDFDLKELDVLEDKNPAAIFAKTRHLMKKYNLEGDGPLAKMSEILEKYDRPEVWGHAANIQGKDPGELARIYLASKE